MNQVRPYDPLTSQNAAVILVDHQIGLMSGVRDYSIGMLKHNIVALAKAAKALKLPIVVTTTARDSMWGPTIPELVQALPGTDIIDRSSVNAYDDARVSRAIEATGRKKLIFAGLSLEVCAALPAMTAVSKGFDSYVPVDACGTFSETKHQAGILRMVQAGVVVSDYCTLMVEILKDNLVPEAGPVYEAMDMDWAKLVGQIAHAYGKQVGLLSGLRALAGKLTAVARCSRCRPWRGNRPAQQLLAAALAVQSVQPYRLGRSPILPLPNRKSQIQMARR